jgi:GDP-L-fucose synthase
LSRQQGNSSVSIGGEMADATRFDLRGKRVYVAGHRGMVGSAVVRRLAREDCTVLSIARAELDLTQTDRVEAWLGQVKPDAVFFAAGKVGGIVANSSFPVDFLQDNLLMALSVIRGSFAAGAKKLMFFGSSCIFPRLAPQPMTEDLLLTGPLEPTNEWYAVAKIAGLKLAEAYRRQHGCDYISVMPTNLYGKGDNYHPEHGHVPAALIRRFHEAKEARAPVVTVWGTGRPRREFLCVDDLADAAVFLMQNYSDTGFINIGVGQDITIAEFAHIVADVVGYDGRIEFDTSRPDGMPQKLLDVSKITALGWRPRVHLKEGLAGAYADFLHGAVRK